MVDDVRTASVTIHVGGLIRYHGVSVDGEYTVRGPAAGRPSIDRTMPITGLDLGPCDNKNTGRIIREAEAAD